MKILFIILLQYLALTSSLSFRNSDAFNSDAFNSDAFNSDAFNSGSIKYCNSYFWHSTSQTQKSIFSYSSNQPTYLSYVVSNVQVSSLDKSFYLISSLPPSLPPSPMPTADPSPSPSPSLAISFGTKIAFSNFNTAELDTESQTAVIIATADSMNISSSFVKYIGTTAQTRRRLINRLYNIIVSLQTTIPLQGQIAKNPSALYLSLIANLEKSVDSGDFMKALPPSFANSTILSVENGKYVVIEPPTDKPGESKTDFNSIIYIVLFLLGILALVKIAYDIQTQKQWYQKSLLFLHLCTIKTPTLSAVMCEQGGADCAFEMRNGVKEKSKKIKKRRDQKNHTTHNDILPDKLDYLYKYNNTQTDAIEYDPEEIFCSISDWDNYNDGLKN